MGEVFLEGEWLWSFNAMLTDGQFKSYDLSFGGGGGGGWHKASVSDCLPLAAPIGLSPLHICGSERVLVVSTEPPDDLSCLTTPGVGRPGDSGGGGCRDNKVYEIMVCLPTPKERLVTALGQAGGGGGDGGGGAKAERRQAKVEEGPFH